MAAAQLASAIAWVLVNWARKLGTEIASIEYADANGGRKLVRYWSMRPTKGKFTPNDEVDQAQWLAVGEALSTLTYARDRALLRSHLETRAQ